MDEPQSQPTEHAAAKAIPADGISVSGWFSFYGGFVGLALACVAVMVSADGVSFQTWLEQFLPTLTAAAPAIKLLCLGLYLTFCCTFLPLPTGWIIAAVATREVAVGGGLWTTVMFVAMAGAIGSTIANLNDYHIMTWMLRNDRIGQVRQTQTYKAAIRWFRKSPFMLVMVFNIIPIPVDVVRPLAATHRYPRMPFAAANFLGRGIRYGLIAFVTYRWNLGWIAPAGLLALAGVLGSIRVIPAILTRLGVSRRERIKT